LDKRQLFYDGVNVIEFSQDGSYFASGSNDGKVLLWSTNAVTDGQEFLFTGRPKMETKHEDGTVYSLALSPDNERIFSGGYDKRLLVHDAST
jgi:WD40 repeat protein